MRCVASTSTWNQREVSQPSFHSIGRGTLINLWEEMGDLQFDDLFASAEKERSIPGG